MIKPGWLQKQFNETEREVKLWPYWLRREAGFEEDRLEVEKKHLVRVVRERKTKAVPIKPKKSR
jgi:hypothetical protein